MIVAVATLAAACTSTATIEQQAASTLAPTTTPSSTVVPSATSEPTPDPSVTPAPTTTPEATATAVPTATPVPSPTPVPTPDTTPVVVEGEGWVITEGDIARLAAFVEETHELEFTSVVTVRVSRDVGQQFAPNFEPFSVDEWSLLQALGLAESQADRDITNQVRRDRIRGLCCRFNNGTQVIVEVEDTKLETEAIIVHELTHALHTQYPVLFENTRFETDETPRPFAASIEGVPQFIAFAYLALAPADELALVTPELPIIRPDMVRLIGPGPSQHLNFAYATGPAFVDAVVAARGIEGLNDLLTEPARTTEQILFPEKYLAGEAAIEVADPSPPAGAAVITTGTIGAAMLMFSLIDQVGESAARELVEPWAGDRIVTYGDSDNVCMVGAIHMDTAEAALALGTALEVSLRTAFPDVTATVLEDLVELRTCATS